MSTSAESTAGQVCRGVSNPGGVPRQFRVQFRVDAGEAWQLYAAFRTRQQAETAIQQLRQPGRETRIVCYEACAAAG